MFNKVQEISRNFFSKFQKYFKKSYRIQENDIFIVSYPKSGNTWMRFLIANALYPKKDINFYNIHELIPELDYAKKDKMSLRSIFKSHSIYNQKFRKVIYIVRDGRDVYSSYYHYLKPNMPKDMTFKNFLVDEKYKLGFWSDHVTSWLNEWDEENFILVKYEDLLSNSENELKNVLNFLNEEYDDDIISNACKASSFKSMRQIESEEGRPNQNNDKVDKFVRKGEAGYWDELFDDEAKEIFKNREGQVLVELGYEKNNQW